jgi:sugar phosphate isomerase/epimerase
MQSTSPPQRQSTPTRRQFLQCGGTAALVCAASTASSADQAQSPAKKPPAKTLHLGLASYTFRAFDLDKTLVEAKRAGLKNICLKSMHLPLSAKPEELAAIAAKVADAGLTLYGGGVIDMSKEAQVVQAFAYGKAAGLRVLVISPAPTMLPLIEQHVKKYDISAAIHNHGPGDRRFPTPQSVYEKVRSLDRRVGLCIDIGHTVRAGVDLVAAVNTCHDRLLDMHVKDVTEATAKGRCIQLGRGVIDVPGLLRALVNVGYQGVASYEYEADEKDPLPGLCECVGYTKGVLATL